MLPPKPFPLGASHWDWGLLGSSKPGLETYRFVRTGVGETLGVGVVDEVSTIVVIVVDDEIGGVSIVVVNSCEFDEIEEVSIVVFTVVDGSVLDETDKVPVVVIAVVDGSKLDFTEEVSIVIVIVVVGSKLDEASIAVEIVGNDSKLDEVDIVSTRDVEGKDTSEDGDEEPEDSVVNDSDE